MQVKIANKMRSHPGCHSRILGESEHAKFYLVAIFCLFKNVHWNSVETSMPKTKYYIFPGVEFLPEISTKFLESFIFYLPSLRNWLSCWQMLAS